MSQFIRRNRDLQIKRCCRMQQPLDMPIKPHDHADIGTHGFKESRRMREAGIED